MRTHAALAIFAAAATIGCGDGSSPRVTITDLRMTPEADGVIRTGTFRLHVAQAADAAGSAAIKLHTLEVDFGEGALFPVSSLLGNAPGDVAPGEEIVRPVTFAIDRFNTDGSDPFTACNVPDPYSLGGTYYDEAEGVFFPVRSEPALLASTWLTDAAWTTTLGEPGAQLERHLAALGDGTSVLVGSKSGSLDFTGKPLSSAGATTPFLVKLDAAGKPAWSRFFPLAGADGTNLLDGPSFVAATPGGGIVMAGAFDGAFDPGDGTITSAGDTDVFFTRLDPSGKALKTRRFGDPSKQTVTAMDVDDEGDVILVGTLEGALDFGSGALAPILDPSFTSYYVARLPEVGAPIYARIPLAVTMARHVTAAAGPSGAVILGGSFGGRAWLGADPIHESAVEAGFLEKLAPDGSVAWSAVADGVVVLAVAIDEDDVVAAVATLSGPATLGGQTLPSGPPGGLLLARFDPAGALRNATRVVEANGVDVPSLVVDSAGHALLAGHTAGTRFLTEIDRSGAKLRTRSFGCAAWPVDLAASRQGPRDVVLAATFTGAVDLGKGLTPAAGESDLLLTKLPAL